MKIADHETTMLCVPSLKTATRRVECHNSLVGMMNSRRKMLENALGRLTGQTTQLVDVAIMLVEALSSGRKALVAGNGGSAAEAQHFAAELVGRFKRERAAYAVIALTTDTSIITAIANDYGYEQVFACQIPALGQPGDLLIIFSTSGESENVLRAAEAGRQRLMSIVAITGECASRLESLADVTIRMPVADRAVVQELHMVVTHMLCDITERQLCTLEGEV